MSTLQDAWLHNVSSLQWNHFEWKSVDPQTATNNGPLNWEWNPKFPNSAVPKWDGLSLRQAPPCPGWHDVELAVHHGLFAPVDTGVAISQLEAWKKMPVLFNGGPILVAISHFCFGTPLIKNAGELWIRGWYHLAFKPAVHHCLFGNFLLCVAVPFGKTLHCLRPFLPVSCELPGVKLQDWLTIHSPRVLSVSLQTWRAKGVSQHVCVRSPFWQRRKARQSKVKAWCDAELAIQT